VDEFPFRTAGEKLPRKTFERVINLFETKFSPLARASGRELVFMTDYEEDWAQAFARRWETDQVIVYGGIAALNNGSEDTFALILCHETGHLYGGRPFSDEFNKLSLEGQADYWGAGECLPQILPSLSVRTPSQGSMKFCEGQITCARAVDAFLAVTAHFADNRSLPHPRPSTPDTQVVESNLRTHSTPQCRLDTMIAGFKKKPRPSCWFKPEP
jgi:hypothetical protein